MHEDNQELEKMLRKGLVALTPQILRGRVMNPRMTGSNNRILALQWVTIAWMLVECSLALHAAWRARSTSLLAFGSDSLIELFSANVVLLQFAPWIRISERRAARLCGSLLYALALIVIVIAFITFFQQLEVDSSPLGIAVTCAALILMPVLARLKRNEANRNGNQALRADAVQSATCAYLAALTLGGLLARMLFDIDRIDSVVALGAVPILLVEARRARQGHFCSHC